MIYSGTDMIANPLSQRTLCMVGGDRRLDEIEG